MQKESKHLQCTNRFSRGSLLLLRLVPISRSSHQSVSRSKLAAGTRVKTEIGCQESYPSRASSYSVCSLTQRVYPSHPPPTYPSDAPSIHLSHPFPDLPLASSCPHYVSHSSTLLPLAPLHPCTLLPLALFNPHTSYTLQPAHLLHPSTRIPLTLFNPHTSSFLIPLHPCILTTLTSLYPVTSPILSGLYLSHPPNP